MGRAIVQSLPMAIAVALSPLRITAVLLVLGTARARSNGLAFLLGWLIGLGLVGTVALCIADTSGASEAGQPARWVDWLQIVIGLLLIAAAIIGFRRPRGNGKSAKREWMSRIDNIEPLGTLGLAAVLAGLNPKNLLLVIGGTIAIAQTGIAGSQQAAAFIVFTAVASVGVGTPVAVYFALGERSAQLLRDVQDWMRRNNAVIMGVLCLAVAAAL